jgi:hypothetical protein
MPGMAPLSYSLQFRGQANAIGSNVLEIRASAPGSTLITTVARAGLAAKLEPGSGEEALLESRLVVADDGALDVRGTIIIGDGHLLHFRTLGAGRISGSPDPELRHGSVVCEIETGQGQFAGARGRIASNFVLSESGELTDNQLGLLFLAQDAQPRAPAMRTLLAATRPIPTNNPLKQEQR